MSQIYLKSLIFCPLVLMIFIDFNVLSIGIVSLKAKLYIFRAKLLYILGRLFRPSATDSSYLGMKITVTIWFNVANLLLLPESR